MKILTFMIKASQVKRVVYTIIAALSTLVYFGSYEGIERSVEVFVGFISLQFLWFFWKTFLWNWEEGFGTIGLLALVAGPLGIFIESAFLPGQNPEILLSYLVVGIWGLHEFEDYLRLKGLSLIELVR